MRRREFDNRRMRSSPVVEVACRFVRRRPGALTVAAGSLPPARCRPDGARIRQQGFSRARCFASDWSCRPIAPHAGQSIWATVQRRGRSDPAARKRGAAGPLRRPTAGRALVARRIGQMPNRQHSVAAGLDWSVERPNRPAGKSTSAATGRVLATHDQRLMPSAAAAMDDEHAAAGTAKVPPVDFQPICD
jgi:hypothetical protein